RGRLTRNLIYSTKPTDPLTGQKSAAYFFNFPARYVKSDVLTPPIFFRFRVAQPERKPLEK
ncbi:hypothetical protein, partial [Klebsiella pneumoniae]|uniref:hypothetical protein n=1 Tax=Klebsiella pneumoniae TaxID=573 RepID=UPI0027D2DCF9